MKSEFDVKDLCLYQIYFFCRWADKLKSKSSDGKIRPFNHPFVQACFMFFGEFLCLLTFKLVYYMMLKRNVRKFLFDFKKFFEL